MPPGYQTTSIVVCPNAVVLGGGVYDDVAEGDQGFVGVFSADKGEKLAEQELPAPLTYNSLAVARGRIYATLRDGSAVCLGK